MNDTDTGAQARTETPEPTYEELSNGLAAAELIIVAMLSRLGGVVVLDDSLLHSVMGRAYTIRRDPESETTVLRFGAQSTYFPVTMVIPAGRSHPYGGER